MTCLLVDHHGPVAVLTLNRPEKLNALSRDLIARITETISALSADAETRAIILTGAGRAFSAGVDLKELSGSSDVTGNDTWSQAENLLDVMRACPHPVIAAVNGFAVTGGLEIALMSDFLIASEAAKFADTHARVGITPSWGMTQILPRLIGINRARQMSLTGEFVSAETACNWGLVNEVVPPDALMPRARELAAQIAETDRATMTRIRDLIGLSAELPLSEALQREVSIFDHHIKTVTPENVEQGRQAVTSRGRKINRQDTSGQEDN